MTGCRVALPHFRLDHHSVAGADAEEPGVVEVDLDLGDLAAVELEGLGALGRQRLQGLLFRAFNRSRQAVVPQAHRRQSRQLVLIEYA